MKVIGVTGLIGSGKSEVMKIFSDCGFDTIDTDYIAKLITDPKHRLGADTLSQIKDYFGEASFDSTGNLNRSFLRKRIESDDKDQKALEAIMHPKILNELELMLSHLSKKSPPAVFIEGTRLVESGFSGKLDSLIFVYAQEDARKKRVKERNQIGSDEFYALSERQNADLMKANSQYSLENSHQELAKLQRDVHNLIQKLGLADGNKT